MSINLKTIVAATQAQLQADATIAGWLATNVERGTVVNEDPNRTPWVGVYRGGQDYSPRTLGSVNNWEVSPSVKIVLQTTSLSDDFEVSDNMEQYVQDIIDAIMTDYTIGGTVDMINGFNVEYGYVNDDRTKMFFQNAIITVNMEVATA